METKLPTNPLFETYVKEHNLETLNVQAINAALFELYEMHLKEKERIMEIGKNVPIGLCETESPNIRKNSLTDNWK